MKSNMVENNKLEIPIKRFILLLLCRHKSYPEAEYPNHNSKSIQLPIFYNIYVYLAVLHLQPHIGTNASALKPKVFPPMPDANTHLRKCT